MKLYSFWRSLATFRVRIALNMKNIDVDVIEVDLLKGHQRKEEFRKVNPQMVVPALVDASGHVLFQSLAILEYLDELYPQPRLLPTNPRARARARGLAMIVACDSHPLIVPRIREFLEHDLHLSEELRNKWIQHWIGEALRTLEQTLASNADTGRYCQGDAITIADICLVSQVVGAQFYKHDLAPYPTVRRIHEACMREHAFDAAHPLRQAGAPARL
jgi:maleylacetoacetate isomerase/maleylpyruvate isomerase